MLWVGSDLGEEERKSVAAAALKHPTSNGGTQKKWKLSRNVCTLRKRFCTFWASIRMLGRRLLNKISASEISRKFIKSALLVGWMDLKGVLGCGPWVWGGGREEGEGERNGWVWGEKNRQIYEFGN